MIEPTPGRVVWYRPKADEVGPAGFTLDGDQPLAAFIAFVHSSTSVNLGVLAATGEIIGRVSVPLVQDRDATEGECEWMPFQKGQAAKAEQLEQKLAEKPAEPAPAPAATAAPESEKPAAPEAAPQPAPQPEASALDQLAQQQPQG